jgi:nucleoid DNA-binding protein
MLKKDMVATVKGAVTNMTNEGAAAIVEALITRIHSGIVAGEKVYIDTVGTFKMQTRPARTGRNPKTGEQIEIAEKNILKFKPSRDLKDAINGKVTPAKAKKNAPIKKATKKA